MGELHVCSFHDCSGSAMVGHRVVHWDFSYQFGPLFVSGEGVPWKNQPKSNSREWRAFETWFTELQAERAAMNATPASARIDELLRGDAP